GETLRRKLGKGLTNAALLKAVEAVAASEARVLKLYFMYGLPGETDEDLAEIGRLTGELRRVLEGSPAHLKISASPFVPKPMTPLVDHPLLSEGELRRKRALLVDILRKAKIAQLTGESPRQALWQSILARGDETLLRRLLAGESKSGLIKEEPRL
ncbi:radical SAM protein, partial [bacterium]|nr:radical SAM protein [bacterium]